MTACSRSRPPSSKRSSGGGGGGVREYPLTRPISYPPPSAPPPLGPPPPPHMVPPAPASLGSVRRPQSYHHHHHHQQQQQQQQQQEEADQQAPHARTQTETLGRALTASARRLKRAPSDEDKVRTTTRVLSMAAKYLGRKLSSIDLGPLSLFGDEEKDGRSGTRAAAWGEDVLAPSQSHWKQAKQLADYNYGTIRPIPRQHLSYHVRRRENGAWQATVSLVQPFVHGQWTDPQGTRPGHITLGFFRTEEGALAACRNHAPPIWAEPAKGAACYLCHTGAATLFKSPCHCRNCGQLVCAKCSRSRWPNGMLPPTYHNNESRVRVCDACNHLALHFRRALKEGDTTRAQKLFASGNVNAWSPYILEGTKEYPVHVAAEGGSLALLRWLVDVLGCPLYDEEDQPLRTQPRGDSVLAVAARRRHAHVMRWLVAGKGCKVAEIADKAQLVAAVEFLLLGEESGASSSGGGADEYALPARASSGRRQRMLEAEEEVKQHEVSDYYYGSGDEEGEDESVLRQGHGLSTRRARATATAATAAGAAGAGSIAKRGKGKGEGKGHVVSECMRCGVSAVDSLILPCGHLCTCHACGQATGECPACGTRVKRVVRLES